jgi:hypothetical protein
MRAVALAASRRERDTGRAMPEVNVEIVRRFMEAMQRSFEAYWENPRSIAAAVEADTLWPEYREVLTYLHPEVEWKTVFLGETHRGYLETAKVWDDYDVFTLREGLIVLLEEYTDRDKALEAAGQPE